MQYRKLLSYNDDSVNEIILTFQSVYSVEWCNHSRKLMRIICNNHSFLASLLTLFFVKGSTFLQVLAVKAG